MNPTWIKILGLIAAAAAAAVPYLGAAIARAARTVDEALASLPSDDDVDDLPEADQPAIDAGTASCPTELTGQLVNVLESIAEASPCQGPGCEADTGSPSVLYCGYDCQKEAVRAYAALHTRPLHTPGIPTSSAYTLAVSSDIAGKFQ